MEILFRNKRNTAKLCMKVSCENIYSFKNYEVDKLNEILCNDMEYIKEAIERFEGKTAETLCEIKWTVDDLRIAYERKYGHNPTDDDVDEILDRLDIKRLKEVGIEYGWEIIHEAI